MLNFARIYVFEGVAVNKASVLKSVLLATVGNFQLDVCNGCYDVLVMFMILNNTAISNIRGIDYRCIINEINKSEAVNLLQKCGFF